METPFRKKITVGCSVSDDTYDQVMREAVRRGITVSELVRHYIEQGLSNPTPKELKRLYNRFTTIETALKELYAMAIVNWSQVKTERKKPGRPPALPLRPEAWKKWKGRLNKKDLVNKLTGKTAYEELTERNDDIPSTEKPDEDDIDEIMREAYKADGTWTEREEKEYQENLRKRIAKKHKNSASQ